MVAFLTNCRKNRHGTSSLCAVTRYKQYDKVMVCANLFIKNESSIFYLKWWEMLLNVIYGHLKWLLVQHFVIFFVKKIKWPIMCSEVIFSHQKLLIQNYFQSSKRWLTDRPTLRNKIKSYHVSKMGNGCHFAKQ